MQQLRVPKRLLDDGMDRVVGMQQLVWEWRPLAISQYRAHSQCRRRVLWCALAGAAVYQWCVPRALSSVVFRGMELLQQIVRHGHTVADSQCGHQGIQRRVHVPGSRADSRLQRTGVRCGLHGVVVRRLGGVLAHVWGRHPAQAAQYRGTAAFGWQGLPATLGAAAVQHAQLPYRLCRVLLVKLAHVQPLLW